MTLFVRRSSLLLVLTAAACFTRDVGSPPPGPPFGPDAQVYFFDATKLVYMFTDTSRPNNYHLRWLNDTIFVGYNCIGLTPRSPTDTVGTFQFYWSNGNTGLLERTNNNVTDTVQGLFLTGLEGTKGTYAINSTGRVVLNWQDWNGTPTRYFDALAVIRLTGDTLRSTADLRFKADSIRSIWDASWIRRPVCG